MNSGKRKYNVISRFAEKKMSRMFLKEEVTCFLLHSDCMTISNYKKRHYVMTFFHAFSSFLITYDKRKQGIYY